MEQRSSDLSEGHQRGGNFAASRPEPFVPLERPGVAIPQGASRSAYPRLTRAPATGRSFVRHVFAVGRIGQAQVHCGWGVKMEPL